MRSILRTRDLQKSFTVKKEQVKAVAGVNLEVGAGEIFGFLGPNGAGKTTTLRMLATLLPIDGGEATVAGFDVKKRPKEVRKRIGYVSQLGGADNEATGYEDLLLQGRLYGMSLAETEPASTNSRGPSNSRSSRTERPRPTPAVSFAASTSRAGSCTARRSSSWTSRRPASIPRIARTSGCTFASFVMPARRSS